MGALATQITVGRRMIWRLAIQQESCVIRHDFLLSGVLIVELETATNDLDLLAQHDSVIILGLAFDPVVEAVIWIVDRQNAPGLSDFAIWIF